MNVKVVSEHRLPQRLPQQSVMQRATLPYEATQPSTAVTEALPSLLDPSPTTSPTSPTLDTGNLIQRQLAFQERQRRTQNSATSQTLPPHAFHETIVQKRQTQKPLVHPEPVRSTYEQVLQTKSTEISLSSNATAAQPNNATGLPNPLKTGVETLSGYSLDNVTVHYNSPKPTEVQALAYAQGTDIHVAPGQEQHLPHEAWHVVQQAQGRVKPTLQMKSGILVNDEQGLEREADVMGARALQTSFVPRMVQPMALPHAEMQRKVFQLLATQITAKKESKDSKESTITQVIVRGRPERVFSGSMGDHTTAFIVHQEGLLIALQGKTITEALKKMAELMAELPKLPGFAFMEIASNGSGAKTEIGGRFLQEYQILHGSLQQAAATADENIRISLLQTAVDAYLSARELVPFSAIKVNEKSQGKAGRGHGESSAAKILSSYERDTTAPITDELLINAVYKLFDYQSAGIVSSAQDSKAVGLMTAGISLDKVPKPVDRLIMIWNQHRLSIQTMFPKVFAKVGNQLTADKIKSVNFKMETAEFNERAQLILVQLAQALKAYQDIPTPTNVDARGRGAGLNMSKVAKIAIIYQIEAHILFLLGQMVKLNQANNNIFAGVLKTIEIAIQTYRGQSDAFRIKKSEIVKQQIDATLLKLTEGALKSKPEEDELVAGEDADFKDTNLKNIRLIKIFTQGSPMEGFATKDDKVVPVPFIPPASVPEDKTPKQKGKTFEATTLTSTLLPMAIQVVLNGKGEVAKMISSGRPYSPFKGSMGAHSTAWAVHLDRVERRIAGKNLVDAIMEMGALREEVLLFAKSREHMQQGVNGRALYPQILQVLTTLNFQKGDNQLAFLQTLINAILTFYNLIPGVSREKTDTGGKGEGTHRRTLLNYERYGVRSKPGMAKAELIADLRAAVNGMYDSPARSGPLWANHLTIIAEAYPDVYALIDGKAEPKAEGKAPAKESIVIDNEDDEGEGYHALTPQELQELQARKGDSSWLVGVNNCLINAITDAAGRPRATADQVIAIRQAIGAPVGEMLFASTRVLDIILNALGLLASGVVVINMGTNYLDHSTNISDNPLYIYHNGINHFDALPRAKEAGKPGDHRNGRAPDPKDRVPGDKDDSSGRQPERERRRSRSRSPRPAAKPSRRRSRSRSRDRVDRK